VAALAEETLELVPGGEETFLPDDLRDVAQPDGLEALDRRLYALSRERGPLRAALARIACRLVFSRGWERLGYARLSDYAVERLGLSARWARSLAQVGEGFRVFPSLEEALLSGTLGWTKVRLLASLPRGEDEATWIARAERVTSEQLSKMVRAVDRGSLEAGALDEETPRSRLFEVRCSADVRWKWNTARGAASRAAGRRLHVSEAAELIAAEVLSALPVDEDAERETCDAANASWSEAATEATAPVDRPMLPPSARHPAWREYGALEELLVGLEQADAFELDDRFRRALSLEQRLDARISPLLALVWSRWVHRALGYPTREAYVRERLGMDPTRARALVRLERAAVLSPPFARAYRTGVLSWVKAGILVPLVSADPLGRFMEDWVAWAGQVTVRRLREDVQWALALEETDRVAFQRSGGLPAEARGEGEISAPQRDAGTDATARLAREIGAVQREPGGEQAPGADAETCSVRFMGPAEVVQLFRAVLCTVRRRMEHNLHDHHIRFRSAGGSDAPENRVTLCAFHHLRGVHASRLRCLGRAPDGLTWQLGIRLGAAPLVAYRSGDRQVATRPRPSWRR
jgi:hypothetical protein